MDESPSEIDIIFFEKGHRHAPRARDGCENARAPGGCLGMRHARATAVQSGIGDAIVHIAGKRFRELPFSRYDLSWG